ncbi:MAG: tetratricopeptide repeat protein [Alphaproteobacteria bacterium]|nr:MAG: tetratricopeptide repeat protein [Alphaproteobacteria bacterium]
MKIFFLYFLFIFPYLFYSNISFSQEVGLKGIIKKQQDKIQLIENNLKSLIGTLENKDINKSISDQLNKIENDLLKITNQYQNLSKYAYELEFRISRIETNLKLPPALKSKSNDINKDMSLQSDIKPKTKIKTQGLNSKTPEVLGFIKTDEEKSDKTNENEIEKKVEQKKVDKYPSNPNEHFKLAEGYLLNDLDKAELAFKNFISTHKDNDKVVDAEYWLGRILFMQKKYSQAALAFAEFNAKYPDDKRYEQISLLIAEATVKYAPKDFICKILIQTFDSIDNPSAKFVKRIKQLKELNSCSNE